MQREEGELDGLEKVTSNKDSLMKMGLLKFGVRFRPHRRKDMILLLNFSM